MMCTPNYIQAPHLVPLPMGEETLPKQTLLSLVHRQGSATLTSPMGRGARQRGEGVISQL